MKRKRTSKLSRLEPGQLAAAHASSKSMGEILEKIGYSYTDDGGARSRLRAALLAEGLAPPDGRWVCERKMPIEDLLVVGRVKTSRGHVKQRLIREGLIRNECSECNVGPIWRGKKLVLVLDHINGRNNDYRLRNLRMLCPNCNSQTDTFSGKNKVFQRTHGAAASMAPSQGGDASSSLAGSTNVPIV